MWSFFEEILSCPTKPPTETFTSAKGTTAKTTIKLTNEEQAVQPTVMNGCEGTKSSSTFTVNGLACIFPFYDGLLCFRLSNTLLLCLGAIEYNTCADWRGKYMWCATSLRNNCKYFKWAKCLDQGEQLNMFLGGHGLGVMAWSDSIHNVTKIVYKVLEISRKFHYWISILHHSSFSFI